VRRMVAYCMFTQHTEHSIGRLTRLPFLSILIFCQVRENSKQFWSNQDPTAAGDQAWQDSLQISRQGPSFQDSR